MRAATYARLGPARDVLRVEELPRPRPGPGEVRVRVHASGINPTDLYARSGARGRTMAHPLVVPHQDGAGVIDEIGLGMDPSLIGQRVWIHMAQWGRAHGTAAEWVVVSSDRVAPLPGGYSFAVGACLGIPWLTAVLAVSSLGPVAGRDVLVAGGSGAVGIYAVQVAASHGARVIATVGSAEAAALVTSAGAFEVLDFRSGDLEARIGEITHGRGVERLIESRISSNAERYPGILAERARIVVYGTAEPQVLVDVSAAIRLQSTFRFVYAYGMSRADRRRACQRLASMEASKPLTHLPVIVYSLDDIVAAHESVEEGNHGHRSVIGLSSADAQLAPRHAD